ncbi:hypothetical protein [Sulfurisphaera tokodaii]|uniref:hypothetical protein n=1 Tax=Sulfurisphaera TaxID=69655 RepID=UPI0030B3B7F0
MVNQIYELLFVGLLTSIINIILQYFVLKVKFKKIESEWITLKSIASLSSFKNYLDVVSADEAQELLEDILVGLRTFPTVDLLSSQVEEKLKSLKSGLKALLDSLNLIDIMNMAYLNSKKNMELGMIMSYSSLVILFISLITPYPLIFIGIALGFNFNSLFLLLNSFTNIERLHKIRKKLKETILQ